MYGFLKLYGGMSVMELISVIVPAYNAEKSIEKCLKSIIWGGV